MATAAEKTEFIRRAWNAIQQQPSLGGLFPSVIIAQAALESAWGQSRLASQYNNYFGVKASATQYSPAWNPQSSPSVNLNTLEYSNGYQSQLATWRVYNSMADSMRDRNALVASNPRYSDALQAQTPLQQVTALKSGGYATDPDYVTKVMATIASNDLTEYDNKVVRQNNWLSSVAADSLSNSTRIGGKYGNTGFAKAALIFIVLVIGIFLIAKYYQKK